MAPVLEDDLHKTLYKSKQGNGVDIYVNPKRHKELVKLLIPKKHAPVDGGREPIIGFSLSDKKK